MFIRRHWWAVLYSVFLIAFTVYLAMDTFVISRVYTVVTETNSETESGTESTAAFDTEEKNEIDSDTEAVVSETAYIDENIQITITEYREYDTSIYVADIILSSPEYLQTAFAQNAYGRNVTEKTSEIAESAGAILAINGDYYGAQEDGYVFRNGVLYRNTSSSGQEDLVIYEDGSFAIINETDVTGEELLADGAQQVLSFGPALIENGTVVVSENDEVGKAKTSNPRTAIGIVDNLHYMFVVSDGRTDENAGLSLLQLSEFMKEFGVTTAYNLDGGGSSTMYFNGKVINNPTTNGEALRKGA